MATGTSSEEQDILPREVFWHDLNLCKYEGFWFPSKRLDATKRVQKQFEAREDDIILTSAMKTGSTWLKVLALSIMLRPTNDSEGKDDNDPLVKKEFHAHVPSLESQVYINEPPLDISSIPSPRLFHTHLPYNVLPDSIKQSKCKMVYITRNPKDTLVSLWHFLNTILPSSELGPYPFEKAFDSFCNGVHIYGPFFDHVLEYWNESLQRPNKILFLRYEDLKRDPNGEVKKLASFIGRPFENDEEIDKVLSRCNISRLKELDVNKSGVPFVGVPNSCFFRLGVVGDWKNYFTDEMRERLDQITRESLKDTGLELDI